MKALTILSAVLLPAVVLAGVMGMNFKLGFFNEPGNFWFGGAGDAGSGGADPWPRSPPALDLRWRSWPRPSACRPLRWQASDDEPRLGEPPPGGRVPKDKEVFLAAITFGSVIWVVLIIGVAVPAAGVWLLSFAPIPDWIDEGLVRLVMLGAVLVLPPVLSLASLKLLRDQDRPEGMAPMLLHFARGYPLAAGLALLLVFLGIIGLVRKVNSLARRWTDTHIPIVVKPGGYEQLAADLDKAISDAGIDIEPRDAPAVMVVPGKLLAVVAGTAIRGLLPDRLVRLVGRDVEVLIYPSDVAISGKQQVPARVQAALASRLTTAQAWLTMSADAQKIEDQLGQLADRGPHEPARSESLAAISMPSSPPSTCLTTSGRSSTGSGSRSSGTCWLATSRVRRCRPPAGRQAVAAPRRGFGLFHRDPLGASFAAGGAALMALNAVLILLERRGNAPRC